ncbi:tripartite tricarboxylate transporter permease [Rhizobium sp. TRM96647]|uniref:tripartite tricarboxylate transporter permease n=1 Tax=unclassified Rhizobium TaxID=2613769 RepID=UPI0021E91033|nr:MULTISPECIES: tripartite tricarboxylate transporter permease [unclassified Rhizobium]MCV3736201.1 tripartite tricarboxylate transporter permease [Rhizobium sp. TRM96647]MCV3758137.1 tripartite tricarboxylate transporter permease [Rhizobium sp. TRM96650]
METLTLLGHGIATAATDPGMLLAIFVGALVGLLIGALPGLGPTAGVAIMLPVAVGFEPTVALAMLAGVYYGAMFGGAVTSILLGIPGDAPSVMTVMDGYPLAKMGQAGRALGLATYASFIGGLIGLIGLTLMANVVSRYALMFGPTEMTALMVLSLSLVAVLGTDDHLKSFLALGIGLWLGMIGLDQIMGGPRFTFGSMALLEGIEFSLIAVGMFGLGQMFMALEEETPDKVDAATYSYRSMLPRLADLVATKTTLVVGSLIGFLVGVLPGAGATASTMMAYGAAKKMSKEPETFGKGALDGVAAPEAANNSASYGAMVTLFTLGIPGSATTAVLLAGLLMVGLQPGPRLFQEQGEFVWTLFGTFYIGNLALVFITILLTPILAAAIFVSRGLLFSIVMGIVIYGIYSIDLSLEALLIMAVFGVLGYVMAKLKYPAVPLIMGVVLGPLLELGVRRTLIASRGDLSVFYSHPISLTIFIATALVIVMPWINRLYQRAMKPSQA